MAIPSFIISGTMYWAFLSKKDQYGKYGFDLVLDQDDGASEALVKQQAPGFVKYDAHKYDGKPYIKPSSKEYPFRVLMDLDNSVRAEGPQAKAPEFKPVAPDQIPLVGNGSIARVKVSPLQTSFAGKNFNKLSVIILQITKFIPYTKTNTDPLNQFYEFPKTTETTTSVGHSQDTASETPQAKRNTTFTDELDDFLRIPV